MDAFLVEMFNCLLGRFDYYRRDGYLLYPSLTKLFTHKFLHFTVAEYYAFAQNVFHVKKLLV